MKTAPDDGQPQESFTFPNIQMDEIAPRLGSINTFRRDGRVLLMDNFHSMGWLQNSLNGSFSISRNFSLNGFTSMRLNPPGLAVNNIESVYRNFPVAYLSTIGYEVSFYLPVTNLYNTLTFTLYLRSGLIEIQTGWQYDFSTFNFSYINNLGVMTPIINERFGFGNWVNVKMVTDYKNRIIRRIAANSQSAEINQPTHNVVTIAGEFFQGTITLNAIANSITPVYFDGFILTTDEA